MIELQNITKRFEEFTALDDISVTVKDSEVFGLIGTNGAGKSTMMRLMSGIYRADEGNVTIDGAPVWDNPSAKSRVFYLSDDQHWGANETPQDAENFFSLFYPAFNKERFSQLLQTFDLDKKRRISTFSKGMKKQLGIFCGICAGTEYLLCDETFDGLDPVVRQAVKSLFAGEMESRRFTPVIASHNLRELEDICDHVGLLHKGGILLSRDLEDMKLGIFKLQCVLKNPEDEEKLTARFPLVCRDRRGSLLTLTLRGAEEEIAEFMDAISPVFYELLPLSLEEIFIAETEVAGYDFKEICV